VAEGRLLLSVFSFLCHLRLLSSTTYPSSDLYTRRLSAGTSVWSFLTEYHRDLVSDDFISHQKGAIDWTRGQCRDWTFISRNLPRACMMRITQVYDCLKFVFTVHRVSASCFKAIIPVAESTIMGSRLMSRGIHSLHWWTNSTWTMNA
jgi:hypothetical protein